MGPGLWSDGNNVDVLYENNLVEDNDGPGIFHEIGGDAIIRNNTSRRNGFGVDGHDGAGILVFSSTNTEVYGNTVVDNAHGIVGKYDDHRAGDYGAKRLENLYVHDNVVSQASGTSGSVVSGAPGSDVWDRWNNRFENNTYTALNPRSFSWRGEELDLSGWQDHGHDLNASVLD
jgi:hypothetical protein